MEKEEASKNHGSYFLGATSILEKLDTNQIPFKECIF